MRKMRFVRIPEGKATIGSPKDEKGRFSDEQQIEVQFDEPFYMMETQVTQAMWESVMGENPSYFKEDQGTEDRPVERVSWHDVQEFIRKLNEIYEDDGIEFRLPTEAEWEYACRAGTTTAYCFGDDPERLDEYAWYSNNSGGRTHRVAQKKPNAWGLYDMHGNVWEWCQDEYRSRKNLDIKHKLNLEVDDG